MGAQSVNKESAIVAPINTDIITTLPIIIGFQGIVICTACFWYSVTNSKISALLYCFIYKGRFKLSNTVS